MVLTPLSRPFSSHPPDERVKIVTDSVAQVPPQFVAQYQVQVVPATLILDEERYQDGVDLVPEHLYQFMRINQAPVKTTSPSVGEFYTHFSACLEESTGAVLYIGLSSKLTATFQAAQHAANLLREKYPKRKIILFDSQTATIAQGFLVMEAAVLAQAGENVDSISEKLADLRPKIGLVATLDTLEYLARGGRIGRAAFMLGNLIQIKPIVTIAHDGMVLPLGRARTMHDALHKMVNIVQKNCHGGRLRRLAILEADATENANLLQELAFSHLSTQEFYWTNFTPTMVAHAGPGIIGLAYQIE